MRLLDLLVARQGGIYVLLFAAAILEVWGDSFFYSALHRHTGLSRCAPLVMGVVILSLYGLFVNLPGWDFGKLLGVYVFFFYAASQIVAYVRFRQAPGLPAYVGGVLIAAGAAVIKFWKG